MIFWLCISAFFSIAAIIWFVYFRVSSKVPVVKNVTVEFKQPSLQMDRNNGASPNLASIGCNNYFSKNQTPVSPAPYVSSYIRNRNESRNSSISYVSPNSIYGSRPKTNVLGERGKSKELQKEFTVKLLPFPKSNNKILSPNTQTTEAPSEILPNSQSNGSFSQISTLSTSTIISPNISRLSPPNVPRSSTKRPIFSNEINEGDNHHLKRSRNHFTYDIDVDECEMFDDDETFARENGLVMNNKKAMKRSTLSLEGELQLNSPQKRVKNNEILSSYSSSSVSNTNNVLNKRKFSPENSLPNPKVKKRTVIEELELLASDISPYYRNIYSPIASSASIIRESPTKHKESKVHSTSSKLPEIEVIDIDNQNVKLISQDDDDDERVEPSDDKDEQLEESAESNSSEEMVEEISDVEERFYPIPAHVFSIKDHQYDKMKSKNRLNQLLAAAQQASEANNDENSTTFRSEDKEVSNLKDLPQASTPNTGPISTTTSTFVFGATKSSPSLTTISKNEKIIMPSPLTTTIVPVETNKPVTNQTTLSSNVPKFSA